MPDVPDLAQLAAEQRVRSMQARNLQAVLVVEFNIAVVGDHPPVVYTPLPEFRDKAAINPWEHSDPDGFQASVHGMWRRWSSLLDQFARGPEFRAVAEPALIGLATQAMIVGDALGAVGG